MKFKQIEVFGFKSFADKTDILFGDGITAIVGPNGCGKSNVADAIRWVLGEQSPRYLRAGKMADVIFNGTEKRKSMSYCEVLLRFDNRPHTDGSKMFPSLEFNEVTVSRKLYRSGESLYLINGKECRLKDVTLLLREGNMGRSGYSIIGQGRIDELLSAKAENRRPIFEEAAGISGHKEKKKEAESKLVRTRENLSRLNDILFEKQSVLEPLSLQAEKARKCLDLRDKLKEHDINIYIHQRDTAEDIKAKIAVSLAGATEELDQKDSEFNQLLNQYRASRDALESFDNDYRALSEMLVDLTAEKEKHKGEINSLVQKKDFILENKEKLLQENTSLQQDLNTLLQQISINSKKRDEKTEKIKTESVLLSQKINTHADLSEELNLRSEKIAQERQSQIDAMEKLSQIKSNLGSLSTEKQLLLSDTHDYQVQIRELAAQIKTADGLLEKSKVEIDRLNTIAKQENDQIKLFTQKDTDLTKKISDLNTDLSDKNRIFYSAKTRHQTYLDMKETREAFGQGVKMLLKSAKEDKGIAKQIEGVLAEVIRVDEQFETAIQVALGQNFQNVIVEKEENANFLIEHLKQNRLGRVTFMPISSAKPRTIDPQYKPLLSTPGCFGVASDLIKFDKKYKSVIDTFLGATLITDTAETATKIAKKCGFALKIATLSGEIFSTNGSISGGSFKANSAVANVFSLERDIDRLTKEVGQLSSDIDSISKEKSTSEKELIIAKEKIKFHSANSHLLEISLTSETDALNHQQKNKETFEKTLSNSNAELEKVSTRLNEIEKDLLSVNELEEFLAKQRQSASLGSQEGSKEYEKAKKDFDELIGKISDDKVKIKSLEGELELISAEIDRAESQQKYFAQKFDQNEVLIKNLLGQIKSTEQEIADISRKADIEDSDQIKQAKQKLDSLDQNKKDLSAKIVFFDNKREEMGQALQGLRDRKAQLSFKLQNVDSDILTKEEQLLKDYDLDYQRCLAFKIDDYDSKKGITEAERVRRQIQNLGEVNIGAIEQVKVAFEEYSNKCAERDDVLKAENDLIKIIKDTSKTMKERFEQEFERIRANFSRIFRELFNGGTADLQILPVEEGEDPLNAGIEIIAHPPQKKIDNISLMSGGERALTAISILFAILRLRPMPFCVLDEIEAALDDANATRFAKYLRRFSQETQFIVITHRKPTMELSDSLYGVTMEEKGVSKIVSVKLAEAVAVAEKDAESKPK